MCNLGEETLKQEKLDKDFFQFESTRRFRRFSIRSFIKTVFRLIGKLLAACILLVVAAHFVPELKEMLPQLYVFIEDFVFKLFNDLYGWVNGLIL